MFNHLAGLWRYRELVRNLVIRDLKARYKNSVLGFLWSLANPLMMMGVFTLVFTTVFPNPIEAYPVFVLSGLLAWNWNVTSVMGGVFSITGNSHLIKKVAFPRELLPLSTVLSNGVNFLLALIPLLVVAAIYFRFPTPLMLILPFIVLIQAIFLTGVALFLACLNVYFRDTEPIMDVLTLAWFFLTPVFYNVENLSQQYSRWIYILNPMASFISTYRLIFYYQSPPALDFILRMSVQSLIVFAIGYAFFLRFAANFGEEV